MVGKRDADVDVNVNVDEDVDGRDEEQEEEEVVVVEEEGSPVVVGCPPAGSRPVSSRSALLDAVVDRLGVDERLRLVVLVLL
jgi:metal-dependent hydrolase (beta-lactamase superfamily II)